LITAGVLFEQNDKVGKQNQLVILSVSKPGNVAGPWSAVLVMFYGFEEFQIENAEYSGY
jgi:hypothetical protein